MASSPSRLRFDGRVAVITGAGNGLGRAYAVYLGALGAKIVVNDLGSSTSGVGASTRAADTVVEEIKSSGGIAVADYNSVEDGDKIVETAIKAFGTIHILINNAGILRDRAFQNMKKEDWDALYKVHLAGTYKCTRAAWNIMREQKFGRIIFVSSAAGLYGNVGQAGYAAFKLAVVGLMNTLALEGAKYNILANTVAPVAGSRMTASVLPAELVDALKPEFVAPFVAYLCHDSCTETSSLYEVGAGWIGKLRWQRSAGAYISHGKGGGMTIEDVRDHWAEMNDFRSDAVTYPVSNQDAFSIIMGFLKPE